MISTLRFGIVGCGAIHAVHAEAIQRTEGAVLSAFCDSDSGRVDSTSERFGVPGFVDFDAFLDHVDVVNVCVPSGLHAEIGIRAAKAGKHVLTEKPIDIRLETATALVEAGEAAGIHLGCISQHRFASDIQRTRQAVHGGELGPMVQGDAYIKWYRSQAYYDSADWRGTWALDGGGCLMNQGVHYIDMLQWIMGGVRSVQAMTRTLAHDIEVEDTAMAMIEFHSGAVGLIQGSTSIFPGLAERIEVHGRHGTVMVEADRIRIWQVDREGASAGPYGRGVQRQPAPNLPTPDNPSEVEASVPEDPTAHWGNQHQLQIEDFVRAVINNRPPAITGRDALEPLRIILAIYESARNGGQRVLL